MIKKRLAILLFSLFIIAGACTQQRQPCVQPILVSLRFSVLSTRLVADSSVNPITYRIVPFDTVLPYSVVGTIGAAKDTAFTFGNSALFSLLLDPNKDSCTWYLSQDSGRVPIDTITFHYTRKLQFLSNACGYTYYYSLTTTPTTPNLKNNLRRNAFDIVHKIDSITIENADVTNNVNLEHLKIYVRDTL